MRRVYHRDFDPEKVACTALQLRTCINELEAEMAALKAASGGDVLTLSIFTATRGGEMTSRLARVPDCPSIAP